jgi:subtilisin family serine protease
MPGQLIGPAFAASFLLAKTEDTESETPVEEDNWAAAAEWAEGQGVDVISSSLGYLTYDSPNMSYTPAEMNGEVAISTRAADIAAARGVVVVNSAGNSGFNPEHNTLGAPADGKKVLSIGAVNSLGTRVDFSSVGPTADGRIKPDVAAQGSGVRVASPLFTKGYVLASGTSFSCPLTAGVVALVLQAHPTYTVDQVLAVVRSTASQSATPDNLLGYGIVNALAALTAPAPPLQ